MSKAKANKSKPKKKHAARLQREQLMTEQRERVKPPDPFGPENRKKLLIRLGIPVAVGWIVALAIGNLYLIIGVGVITLVIIGFLVWILRFSRKTMAVADIVRGADTAEARKEALEKLGSDFKDGDVAATFAKAQLQMQDDPRAALETLEGIDLKKVMAPMADEARSQRAMIHLMLGETDEARALVDHIDLSRHKEPRTQATLASIQAEAWARTGQAKKAIEILEMFEPEDETYQDLRPQLYRSLAFAYAWANKTKQMKQVLRKMKNLNAQLLMGFVTKKKNPHGVPPRGVHPVLEKEAYNMVMRSGAVPRKMQVRRG